MRMQLAITWHHRIPLACLGGIVSGRPDISHFRAARSFAGRSTRAGSACLCYSLKTTLKRPLLTVNAPLPA